MLARRVPANAIDGFPRRVPTNLKLRAPTISDQQLPGPPQPLVRRDKGGNWLQMIRLDQSAAGVLRLPLLAPVKWFGGLISECPQMCC
jgi:hypothetical protein